MIGAEVKAMKGKKSDRMATPPDDEPDEAELTEEESAPVSPRSAHGSQAKAIVIAAVITALATLAIAVLNLIPSESSFEYEGLVHDVETDRGISGAAVELWVGDKLYPRKTDDAGYFKVTLLRTNLEVSVQLGVKATSYEPYYKPRVTLTPEDVLPVPLKWVSKVATGERIGPKPEDLRDPDAGEDPRTEKSLQRTHHPDSWTRNLFLDAGSPRFWFDQARFYRRTDADHRSGFAGSDPRPATVVRRYLSADHRLDGAFGPGWHHNFESRIDVERSTIGRIIYLDESGAQVAFEPAQVLASHVEKLRGHVPGATLETPLSVVLAAELRGDSPYFLSALEGFGYIAARLDVAQLDFVREHIRIRLHDNSEYLFNRRGQLEVIRKAFQPTLKLHYDRDRLRRVEAPSDKSLAAEIDYNDVSGRISAIVYEDGSSYEYHYDDEGRLESVRLNQKTVFTYGYDEAGRLDHVEESRKSQPLDIKYNQVGWRVKLERGPERWMKWEFFDHPHLPEIRLENRKSEWSKDTTRFTFDDLTEELTMVDELLQERTTYRLTRCGCKPLRVMRNGLTTKYVYDELGFLNRIDGPAHVKEYQRDQTFHQVTTYVAKSVPDGTVSEHIIFGYDNGELVVAEDQLGKSKVELRYNDARRVSLMELHRQGSSRATVIKFTYTDSGKPATVEIDNIGKAVIGYDSEDEVDRVQGDNYQEVLAETQRALRLVEPRTPKPDTRFSRIQGSP